MNYHKVSLINRRNMLFDEYLSTLDKINIWKKKGKQLIICKDTSSRDHKREMIKLLTDHLRITSKKLREIDTELTGIRVKADDSHTIEEIN
jgi:choline kinase